MSDIIKNQDSRRIFIDTLIELREKDPKILLIVNDVGFNYVDEFVKRFPESYKNFGVTEQSTMIIAAGLALSGFKPYVYSMINFVVFRPYEMVRNAICYHNANVKLIGVKGSEKYKFLGFSHNITEDEDIEVLKNLPNLRTFIPSSFEQIREDMLEMYKTNKPCYLRL